MAVFRLTDGSAASLSVTSGETCLFHHFCRRKNLFSFVNLGYKNSVPSLNSAYIAMAKTIKKPAVRRKRNVEREDNVPADDRTESQVYQELEAWKRLHETSTRIISEGDVNKLFDEILDAAVFVMQADFGSIQLWDEVTGTLHLVTALNFDEELREHFRAVSSAEGAASAVALRSKERVVVPDIETSPIFQNHQERLKQMRRVGARAIQSTPLISRSGRVMGIMGTAWHKVHQPSSKELHMLDLLSRQAADLFERNEAEEALRRSEEKFRTLCEAGPALIWYTDPDGNNIYVNQHYIEFVGKPAEELLDNGWQPLLHPDDAERYKAAGRASLRKGTPFHQRVRMKRHDGQWRWIESFGKPHFAADGTFLGLVGVSPDVTETVEAERRAVATQEKLRLNEERLRLLTESFTDYAIFSIDVDGQIQSWNRGAEHLFGYSEDEIVGQPTAIIFTPEDREAGVPENEMMTARKLGRAADERWHLRKNGTRFFASGAMAPLFDEETLIGYAKIARDLTESKRIEIELNQYRETLEARVAERTAALKATNASLRQEIIDRHRIENERSALLRRIVSIQEDERRRISRDIHDQLGQRLTALRLKIASMKEACADDPELCRRVERLEDIGVGLDSEVNFLAFELRPSVLDDLGLVAAIGNFVREWSQHYGIAAEFHASGLRRKRLEPDLETNLYRVTQEALNNTLKHARASNASVLLEVRKKSVILIVEDDGVGFDAAATKKRMPGTGLGLVGMRERAALFGGTVEIESAPNRGTTIFARIPAVFVSTEERNGR